MTKVERDLINNDYAKTGIYEFYTEELNIVTI